MGIGRNNYLSDEKSCDSYKVNINIMQL